MRLRAFFATSIALLVAAPAAGQTAESQPDYQTVINRFTRCLNDGAAGAPANLPITDAATIVHNGCQAQFQAALAANRAEFQRDVAGANEAAIRAAWQAVGQSIARRRARNASPASPATSAPPAS